MKLENQVCTAEQGKRLKELGVTAESYFMWVGAFPGSDISPEVALTDQSQCEPSINGYYGRPDNTYPAYTVAELGVALPFGKFCIPIFEGEITPSIDVLYEVHLETWITPNRYRTVLVDAEFRKKYMDSGIDYTMAQSLASMLISMLEKGIIDAESCNQRLKNS